MGTATAFLYIPTNCVGGLGRIAKPHNKYRVVDRGRLDLSGPNKWLVTLPEAISERRYLMTVEYRDAKPAVSLDHKRITLTVRPGGDAKKRAEVIHERHKSLLH